MNKQSKEAILKQYGFAKESTDEDMYRAITSAMEEYHAQFTAGNAVSYDEIVYVPVSVMDKDNPPPKDKDFYVVFDNGCIVSFYDDVLPLDIYDAWLKPIKVGNIYTDADMMNLIEWCGNEGFNLIDDGESTISLFDKYLQSRLEK